MWLSRIWPKASDSGSGENTHAGTEGTTLKKGVVLRGTEAFRQKPLLDRQREVSLLLQRYTHRLPVIAVPHRRSHLPVCDKGKLLVPGDFTVGKMMILLRSKLRLKPTEAIFIFAETCRGSTTTAATTTATTTTSSSRPTVTLLPVSATLYDMYDQYKDEDGFLYLIYSSDDAFGKKPSSFSSLT